MAKIYFIYGVLICGLLAWANLTGWTILGSKGKSWGPGGQARTQGTFYHK